MQRKRQNTILFTAFCLFLALFVHSQYNGSVDFQTAISLFNEYGKNKTLVSNLDSSKIYMDRSFLDENISRTAINNYYYAELHKEIYKVREKGDINSQNRKIAIDKFMICLNLDTSKKNRDMVNNKLKWIAAQFYNEAKEVLEKNSDVELARRGFKEYKKIYATADPLIDMKVKEIEFELACGSMLQEKADKTGRKDYSDLAKVSYFKVLDIDSSNYDANYNIGIIYYNAGANLIMKVLDYDTPLDSITIIEDMAKKLFIQAKPFMHKANLGKPNCLKIMEGLMGIYYSLNEEDTFKKYKELFEKLKSDIESGIIKEEC
ncbi:MAG: hypothetical protein ACK5D5_10135 [Bacteroidota bacterium]|jgi:hypothetical protein